MIIVIISYFPFLCKYLFSFVCTGCNFRGLKSDVESHSHVCGFVTSQGSDLLPRLLNQEAVVEKLKTDNKLLNDQVLELQTANKEMRTQMEKQNM